MNADDRLTNFRASYLHLEHRVQAALLAPDNNLEGFRVLRSDILRLLGAADGHQNVFSFEEYNTLRTSCAAMLEALDATRHNNQDRGIAATVIFRRQGMNPGRPRIDFDPNILAFALETRGPTEIGRLLRCSARTVRRRSTEYGLVSDGQAPFDGPLVRVQGRMRGQHWNGPIKRTQLSDILAEELDVRVAYILQNNPHFGRRMIDGKLRSEGIRVSRHRIEESYLRVHGPPAGFFNRPIARRQYRVAGVNSVWHHDGQHGLIQYKIVTHMFVDGYSRFIAGARASNNNRAATVLDLFIQATTHGVPKRMRGDHGVENVDVARWMDVHRGPGSYLWGPSHANTRAERLWRDYTQAVGQKWKNLFIDLENDYGLDPNNAAHIWLLHCLFLESINRDIQEWVSTWNHHKISLRGQRDRSPRDLYLFGMVQHGIRGVHDGVHPINQHADVPPIGQDGGRLPAHMNEVVCEVGHPNVPLEFEDLLQDWLQGDQDVDLFTQNMATCCLVWERALEVCIELANDMGMEFRS